MYIVVFATASNRKEAERIAGEVVKAKLAACVNIIANVESFFWWEAKIDHAREALLIIKTRKALLRKLIKRIKSLHSYAVPEIIALPIIAGHEKYLEWVDESTR